MPGLGKNNEGVVEPLIPQLKLDTKGLRTEEERAAAQRKSNVQAMYNIPQVPGAKKKGKQKANQLKANQMNCNPMNNNPFNGNPINGNPINGNPMNGNPMNGVPMNAVPMNGIPPPNNLQPPNSFQPSNAGNEQLTQFANHSIVNGKHPVTVLQEACLKRKWKQPVYSVVNEDGPPHKPHFLMKCTLNQVDYIPSFSSPNKKLAKAIAAIVCLQAFGLIDCAAS